MNRTIALPALVAELARTNNCADETASEFLHALARVVSKGLAEDGAVTVSGIGIFKIIDKPGGPEVEFLPDAELAAEVNAPFSLFEPVELAAGVSAADLDMETATATEVPEVPYAPALTETEEATEPATPVIPEPAKPEVPAGLPPVPAADTVTDTIPDTGVPETEPEPETETVPEPQPEPQTEPQPKAAPEPEPAPAPAPQPLRKPRTINETYSQTTRTYTATTHEPVREERIVKVVDRRPNRSTVALAAVIALVAGLVIGYLAYDWLNFNGPRNVEISAEKVNVHPAVPVVFETDTTATEVVPADTARNAAAAAENRAAQSVSAETAKASVTVTDTVGGRRYLSVIARQHYGKDIFWVYIYEENKDRISNPNNVPEGLVVVIPPAEKYNIDPSSKESVHAAERKAAHIMDGRK